MAHPEQPPPDTNRILVKLRPSAASALRVAESRANLRPLYDVPAGTADAFGASAEPRWFLAEIEDGGPTPWDLAHSRVADQLGVDGSDVVFAEPDLAHRIYPDPNAREQGGLLAVGEQCVTKPQEGDDGKAMGPHASWHLDDDFTQLRRAREAVVFTDPLRTRIAHIDTGYFGAHVTRPRRLNAGLQQNFVDKDGKPANAEDPDNKLRILDNSGHGTGTLSVLAGSAFDIPGRERMDMGGAPDAEIVPLRIADSVVLFHTSAFARALDYAVKAQCDVLSMSMGGLPSDAWREAIDRAYLAGLCMVTAAGNNFSGIPTRKVVYPARYSRVICACGAMADRKPYVRLKNREMEGNFGPDKVMKHALSAYTPNIPWAVFGCKDVIRLNGGGTSSATPQIAAAAALWLERHKAVLPRSWRRVEAVRKALFTTAAKADEKHLGHGLLRAFDALGVAPDLTLGQTKSDGDSFAFLRVLTGLGLAEAPPRERMFNLEMAQLWLLSPDLQELAPDPDDEPLDRARLERLMDAVIADPRASVALRRHVALRYHVVAGRPAPTGPTTRGVVPEPLRACDADRTPPTPAHRRVRAYAMDPSFSTRLDTAGVNEVTLQVRWEELEPGPVGEYLAVTDTDASGREYAGVDLDDPRLLAQDGWAPSEGNPQFHQQMVYAVAMRTIQAFERALGRAVLWRHRANPEDEFDDSGFVRQLAVRPHALRQANAFYSPREISLLFGYFESAPSDPGDQMPGSRVYTCLSHDIIAHETTHAILDGMHRRFNEATNPDVLAFHEAFADIVALLQHFTISEVLEREIERTRGDIEAESILGSLAVQFGKGIGARGALRDAIGRTVDGSWKRFAPDPSELPRRDTPHGRGAILVAAVFDAFLAIYRARVQDLLRINTGGTGVLPAGAIHPDLVRRLAEEAAKAAGHVLTMCIRGLDYLPPVDVTFFEYLRALITADYDLVREDRYQYRVAFVDAFRRRGIYPVDVDVSTAETVRTLSVDTLRWRGLDHSALAPDVRRAVARQYRSIIDRLKKFADKCLYVDDRQTLYDAARAERRALHERLVVAFAAVPEFARELGLDPQHGFEVHDLRPAMRVSPDGRYVPQVVVALTQSTRVPEDGEAGVPAHIFRGGSTLVVDLAVPEVKYRVVKNVASHTRRERMAEMVRATAGDPLRALFFGSDRAEPFAALHSLADVEGA